MNKKIKYIIIVVIILVLASVIYFLIPKEKPKIYSNNPIKYFTLSANIKFSNVENNFKFYDEYGELVKEETFNDKGDVSYSFYNKDYVYNCGPGGVYRTNCKNFEVEKISEEDVNIVRTFDENVYFYINNGFISDGYNSVILSENNSVNFNFHIFDFVVKDNTYYVLGKEEFCIYKDGKIINSIDISNLGIYQDILYTEGRIILISSDNFYEIKDNDMFLLSKNNKIKDLNFIIFTNSINEKCIFDYDLKKVFVYEVKDNCIEFIKEINLENRGKTTFSYSDNDTFLYNIDYNNKKVLLTDLKDGNLINELKIELEEKESLFSIYIF